MAEQREILHSSMISGCAHPCVADCTELQLLSVQWVNPLDDTAGQSFDGQSSINMVLGSPSFLLPKPFVSTECDHLYVSKWGLSDIGHKVDTVEMCRCRVKMEVT